MRRVLRRFARVALLAALVAPAAAASVAQGDDFEQKYQEKLKKEFVEFGGWVTDYDEARATAKKEGKVLFVYFSRSYSP